MKILNTLKPTHMEPYSIPISLLRQYAFCPRIIYFSLLRGIDPASPLWVRQGVDEHDRQAQLNKRRSFARYLSLLQNETEYRVLTNVHVRSERLGIHGICDAVIVFDDGSRYVVEFKKKLPNKGNIGALLQLTAYCMALEDEKNCLQKYAFIMYGERGKLHRHEITLEWRQKVENVKRSVDLILEEGLMPDSSATEIQCCQCEYLNFCADRF